MKCRICGSTNLIEYLDLGMHPPSDAFLSREQFDSETVFPLTVLYCTNCSLSQLGYVVPAEELYKDDYPYETGMNNEGIIHFRNMAVDLSKRFRPKFVVDVGSNDGTLLSGFDCKVTGIEPVKDLCDKARVHTINGFFDSNTAAAALVYGGKADLITACNVFAHIDNLHGFMWHIDRLLSGKGVFVIEAPYLPDMIESLAFDTIYHEHLSYLSIKPLIHLLRQYDMEIFHCSHHDIHCGTMRYYVARKGVHPFTTMVNIYRELEEKYHDIEVLENFAFDTWVTFHGFSGYLQKLKREGNSIVGASAPAKGNTFLNFCGIDYKVLDYITEKSQRKIGRYTPGSHILIKKDEELLKDNPDYCLILSHNWADQIKSSLKDYRGVFINANQQGIKDFCSGSFRISRECDCTGTPQEGLHECCGLPGRPDQQNADMGTV